MTAAPMPLVPPVSSVPPEDEDVFDNGYLRVEHDNYYVAVDGRALNFPRAEFLLISRLVRNPERVITAEELWQYMWSDRKPLNLDSLHVYVYRLRAKLEPFGLKIETMVGVGYRLSLAAAQQARVRR